MWSFQGNMGAGLSMDPKLVLTYLYADTQEHRCRHFFVKYNIIAKLNVVLYFFIKVTTDQSSFRTPKNNIIILNLLTSLYIDDIQGRVGTHPLHKTA